MIQPLKEWLCEQVFKGHKIKYALQMGWNREHLMEIVCECERCGYVGIMDRDEFDKIFYRDNK